jgi:hypothetical protein
MADPTPFVPGYSYTDYQETAPADPLPGPQVDNDFADVATSTVTLVNAVKDIRRSDGKLKNAIVTYDSLSAGLKALLSNNTGQTIPGSFSPEDFGAKGDGVTDDTAAFEAALTAGPAIRLNDFATYKVVDLAVGDGNIIYCAPGASSFVGATGGTTLRLTGGALIDGPNMFGAVDYHLRHDAAAGALTNVTLRNIHAVGGVFGLYTFGYGTICRDWEISNSFFEGIANPMLFETLSDSRLLNNKFSGAGGASIQFRNGQRNLVQGGSIEGGTTGINFLGLFSNYQFLSGTIEGNVIDDVRFGGVAEENVSFDNGGTAADVLSREVAKVSAKTSDADYYYITYVPLTSGSWAGSTGLFAGSYTIFTTGAAAGVVCKAVYNTLGVFAYKRGTAAVPGQEMTAAQYAAIAVNDIVVIGLPFLRNVVTNCRIDAVTSADHYSIGTLFYGMSVANVSEGNTIAIQRTLSSDLGRAIGVSSLAAVDGAGSFVSNAGDQRWAPSIGNLVQGNTVKGDVVFDYNDFSAGLTPYESGGNRPFGNTIQGALTITNHVDLRDGNLETP